MREAATAETAADSNGRSAWPLRRLTRARVSLYREPRGAARARVARIALRAAGVFVVMSVVAFASLVGYYHWHYSKVVDARLAAGYLSSRAGVYAAPRVLRAGQKLSPERLTSILRRAGYVDTGAPGRVWSGRFNADANSVTIVPAAQDATAARGPREVRVTFDRAGRVAEVTGDGAGLESYTLEPEPLADETALRSAGRETLTFKDLPPALVKAILATEDRRFFEHSGVDLWAVARAALSWGDAGEGELRQGGSTVTQQLVKNTYLTPERTLRRKFHEAVIAGVIERRLSKEEILALYCNEIYLGQRGGAAVRGVREAARAYFGKELKVLTLSEAATIAGMIRSPARHAPDRHPEGARARRDTVLAGMVSAGAVTLEEARAAAAEPLNVAPAERREAVAPYFVDYVNRVVEGRRGAARGEGRRGRVYTTIDLELQRAAEESVGRQLERLAKVFKGKKNPQAALVALDPHTGRVLAMVGGASYAESQLNRATDARRQPGSVFKPVVYAAALESGLSPLSVSLDAPREFQYDRRASYRPANYGGGYTMRDVTLREALVRSLNVVTVDTALRTGLARVSSLAEKLGLPRPEAYPSLALGTTEATPLEVASAYTAFAAGGRRVRPTPLLGVEEAGDTGAPAAGLTDLPVAEQVLKPSTAYVLTDMLSQVIERGTARAARGAFDDVAVAGKTGTSRDGWFAGYTPNLVCVVWVGFDDNEELDLTGADSALPVWTEFVRRAVELRPELGGARFERPESVTTVEVDPETGGRAHEGCPRRERAALALGTAPAYECPLHRPAYEELAAAETSVVAAQATHLSATAAVATPAPPETRAVTVPRLESDRPADIAPRPASPAPAHIRATRVEVESGGRARLTNDLKPVASGEYRPR
jgi:penicillin-binding protein 1B